jgi:8-oxo-dGTP diphosphatase
MKFEVAVKGIIRKGGKILVLRRSIDDDHKPGVWETVGGGIDRKNTPQNALKREVEEETGLKVKILEPFNAFSFKKDTGEFKIGITFLCDYAGGKVKLSKEHIDYKWIKPSEFANMKTLPSLHREIKNYAEKYEK